MGEWISVKDKLPEPNELVLLYCTFHEWNKPNEKWQDITVGRTDKYNNQIYPEHYEEGTNFDVTHWQPLPEPPTIENEPS